MCLITYEQGVLTPCQNKNKYQFLNKFTIFFLLILKLKLQKVLLYLQ